MHCQLDGLPLEITPILPWHSACEFVQPLEEAFPLPVSRVIYYCPCAAHQMACRLLHYVHDLVQAGWLFLFIFFSSLFSSFLGFSQRDGIDHNRYFGRHLFHELELLSCPRSSCSGSWSSSDSCSVDVPVGASYLLCWSSTYCTTTLNGFMTLFVKWFQIWKMFQLPLLSSCSWPCFIPLVFKLLAVSP